MVKTKNREAFSVKMFERFLAIAGILLAVAGIVVLVVNYWEKLTTLCPCHKDKGLQDASDWEREAADYADVE